LPLEAVVDTLIPPLHENRCVAHITVVCATCTFPLATACKLTCHGRGMFFILYWRVHPTCWVY